MKPQPSIPAGWIWAYWLDPAAYMVYGLTASQVGGDWVGRDACKAPALPCAGSTRSPLTAACRTSRTTHPPQLGDVTSLTAIPDGAGTKEVPVNQFVQDYFGFKHDFIVSRGWAVGLAWVGGWWRRQGGWTRRPALPVRGVAPHPSHPPQPMPPVGVLCAGAVRLPAGLPPAGPARLAEAYLPEALDLLSAERERASSKERSSHGPRVCLSPFVKFIPRTLSFILLMPFPGLPGAGWDSHAHGNSAAPRPRSNPRASTLPRISSPIPIFPRSHPCVPSTGHLLQSVLLIE